MALKHEYLRLDNCFVAQRQVYSHLVTVKVCIKRCTCKRMQLNSFALDKSGLESLNTQTVKCRCTVEKHRMTLHYIFENVPYNRIMAVDYLLGTLHSFHYTTLYKLAYDEWFVKFCSHKFRETTLTHFEFRTNNNHRTRRIVYTFTEKILTETTRFTFESI